MKKKKYIAIVAGGVLQKEAISAVQKADYVIGVDKGAYWLIARGVIPDCAIGDFDSVSTRELRVIKAKVKHVFSYPPEKDATDMELAIEHARTQEPTEVGIFGALGTRYDHVHAGIQMLLRLSSHNIYGYIVDNFNKIFIVRRKETVAKDSQWPYISLFPLEKEAVLTLRGFRYNVTRQIFTRESTLGVSNELSAKKGHITVHKGAVIVIRSRD